MTPTDAEGPAASVGSAGPLPVGSLQAAKSDRPPTGPIDALEAPSPRATLLGGALLLLTLGLVLWVRCLTLSMDGLDGDAEQGVRQQIREQIEGSVSPDLPAAERDARLQRGVDEVIARDPSQFDQMRHAATEQLKAERRYTGADGREYPYLGDLDSYLWLRRAQTYLDTGTTCDAVVDGVCRDTFTLAPVGRTMRYRRSLHIAAIVAVHRLMTLLDPGHPLPASAALVPIVVGVLGVVPAFAIGWRLAGPVGALGAALLISVNPLALARSAGSDNDVWNIVLPLFTVWAAMAALDAARVWKRAAYALLAAGFVALHAATWSGWVLTYLVLFTALLGNVAVQGMRWTIERWRTHGGSTRYLRHATVVWVTFYLGVGLLTDPSAWGQPWRVLHSQFATVAYAAVPPSASIPPWPDNFSTVKELAVPSLAVIAGDMQGPLLFFISLMGLLTLILPRHRWHARHVGVLIGGGIFYRYLLTASGLAPVAELRLAATPLAAAAVVHLFDNDRDVDHGAQWIVVLWFLAALFQAHAGRRFVLLLVPPCGIACAATLGRLHVWLDGLALGMRGRQRGLMRAAVFVALAVTLVFPVRQGVAAAPQILPSMNDAWWDTLIALRDRTAADAIVDTWWDYGHWVPYVARRRVSADGSTLLTRTPQWLAGALLMRSEDESVGVLRMLNCGSDAAGEPEERLGAYGRLMAAGLDAVAAQRAVVELGTLGRSQAEALLQAYGVPATARADVLAATHCMPPPSYLVLSDSMSTMYGWWRIGSWASTHARMARAVLSRPEDEAIAYAMRRFGYSASDAYHLYVTVKSFGSPAELEKFIAPAQGYLSPDWQRCDAAGADGDIVCPLGFALNELGTELRTFTYRPDAPADSFLSLSDCQQATPGELLVARPDRLERISFASPTLPDWAVLFDPVERRVLIGTPDLINSTFTQLVFLDGRYARHFRKFAEHEVVGERVVAWQIDWPG